jgi:hypothetical protein
MKLIHYSNKEIKKLLENYHSENFIKTMPMTKPIGFWVSVKGEDDWQSWCEKEGFRLDALKYQYEVKLKKNSNILYLKTILDLKNFSEKYKSKSLMALEENLEIENEKDKQIIEEISSFADKYFSDFISWNKLRLDYDGIIISPYQWDFRYTTWYYGWDCASGCIWNINSIKEIKLIKVLDKIE